MISPNYSENVVQFYLLNLKSLDILPRTRQPLSICADFRRTKYEIFTKIVNETGINEAEVDDDKQSCSETAEDEILFDSVAEKADLIWNDLYVSHDFIKCLKKHQKINHFPGSWILGKKNLLYKQILKMKKKYEEEYSFLPNTYLYPLQANQIRTLAQNLNSDKFYIVKPEASCQGKGIFLTRNFKKLLSRDIPYVVQEYLSEPLLIDELKFDIRLYVLLKTLNPLSVYLFKEGLVRFCTEKYTKPSNTNFKNMFMHLTNYAVNKNNSKFVPANSLDKEHLSHKRSFSWLLTYLQNEGHDYKKMLEDISNLILKTITAAFPILFHDYIVCQPKKDNNTNCFEILGFDIMLDKNLKPWLLEVNHTPSFKTDSILDLTIKKNLLTDTIYLCFKHTNNPEIYGGFHRLLPSINEEHNQFILKGLENAKNVEAQEFYGKYHQRAESFRISKKGAVTEQAQPSKIITKQTICIDTKDKLKTQANQPKLQIQSKISQTMCSPYLSKNKNKSKANNLGLSNYEIPVPPKTGFQHLRHSQIDQNKIKIFNKQDATPKEISLSAFPLIDPETIDKFQTMRKGALRDILRHEKNRISTDQNNFIEFALPSIELYDPFDTYQSMAKKQNPDQKKQKKLAQKVFDVNCLQKNEDIKKSINLSKLKYPDKKSNVIELKNYSIGPPRQTTEIESNNCNNTKKIEEKTQLIISDYIDVTLKKMNNTEWSKFCKNNKKIKYSKVLGDE